MSRKALNVALAVATVFAANIGAAQAQARRTFVSGHGADSGTCSVTAPCRSFAYAISQTAAGGEIVVLDSAGYGAVTIAQSVSITNPGGVEAGISTTSGETAISIDAAGTANVTLRGLTLEGGGVGATGISLTSTLPNANNGGSLNIIGCVIKDFSGNGVAIKPGAVGGGLLPTMTVTIADAFVLNNGGAGISIDNTVDINLFPQIYRTVMTGNTTGLTVAASGDGDLGALLTDSHVDANINYGVTVTGIAALTMRSSTATSTYVAIEGDVYSTGVIALFNGNLIGSVMTTGSGETDGTNNINVLSGTLTKAALR